MTILFFVVILLFLVVGHEAGHFALAKWTGMKVPEFGIGFPPKLWGKKIGDTEYTINALPFGGFVKIYGEDLTDENTEAGSAAFSNRPFLAQAATLLAGPFSNLLIAFFLISAAFMLGMPASADSGFEPAYIHGVKLTVVDTLPDSPAAQAGISPGAEIVSVTEGGKTEAVSSPEEVADAITAVGAHPVTLGLLENGMSSSVTVTPEKGVDPENPDRLAIGLASASVGTLVLPPLAAFHEGFSETLADIFGVFFGIVSLIWHSLTFSADLSAIAGPVGIASLVGSAASFGVGSVLSFAALISVNLGVINLFPFPALDGGRFVMALYEAISRRRISARIASTINLVGFALLIILMLAVTVHDIARLIS